MPVIKNLDKLKEEMYADLRYRLGEGIIDTECDPEHFESAYKYAISTYRQRGQNSNEESYTLMTLQANQNVYTLPDQFVNIRQVFRRTIGMETGPGSMAFDPFSSAILNTYLLNYSQAGGLATYEMYSQYVKLNARMFGGYVIHTFNPVTKELRIVRDPKGTGESLLIWGDMQRPEEHLILHPQIGPWITSWTLAQLKIIIGEAREMFGSIAGPGGGNSMNGTAMKAEGKEIHEKLLEDLKNYVDGSQPLSFLIG